LLLRSLSKPYKLIPQKTRFRPRSSILPEVVASSQENSSKFSTIFFWECRKDHG
jgi:hypothetical protein